MKIAVKTLMAMSGPDGRHPKDVIIHVAPDRADFLTKNGFAARVDAPAREPAPKPARKVASKATAAKAPRKAK